MKRALDIIQALETMNFTNDELKAINNSYRFAVLRTTNNAKLGFSPGEHVLFNHPVLGRIEAVVLRILKKNIELRTTSKERFGMIMRLSPRELKKIALEEDQ